MNYKDEDFDHPWLAGEVFKALENKAEEARKIEIMVT